MITMNPTWPRALPAWAVAAALAGCGGGTESAPSDADVLRAEALRPADAPLAAKYERSCVVCHTVRGGAPLAGFEPAWARRRAQGAEVLLDHARLGFNAMPPRGMCSDCSDDELRRLISFMSQAQ
jgi:cytochrome c5